MGFQLGAALLEGCVLAVLSQGDTYGYVLTQRVRQAMDISESTLYPVLRRLEKEGFLGAYDQNYQGRNRRYYTITAQGRDHYREICQQWSRFKGQIDNILLEGKKDDQYPVSG